MKDLYSNIIAEQTIAPVTGGNSAAPAAVEIDLAGANSAVILVLTGANGGTLTANNYWTWALSHADDDGSGASDSYADCVTADVQGATISATGIVVTVNAEDEDSTIYKVGYVGGKRFIKITPAEAGTAPDLLQAVVCIKGDLLDAPPIA